MRLPPPSTRSFTRTEQCCTCPLQSSGPRVTRTCAAGRSTNNNVNWSSDRGPKTVSRWTSPSKTGPLKSTSTQTQLTTLTGPWSNRPSLRKQNITNVAKNLILLLTSTSLFRGARLSTNSPFWFHFSVICSHQLWYIVLFFFKTYSIVF